MGEYYYVVGGSGVAGMATNRLAAKRRTDALSAKFMWERYTALAAVVSRELCPHSRRSAYARVTLP